MGNANCNRIFYYGNQFDLGLELEMTEWHSQAESGVFYLFKTIIHLDNKTPHFVKVEFFDKFMYPWEAKVFSEVRLVQTLEWLEKNGSPKQIDLAKQELGRLTFIQGLAIDSFPDYNSQRQDKK